MTDSTTRIPTDADIIALADKTRTGEPGRDGYILPISFARAVLAKWCAPAAALPPELSSIAKQASIAAAEVTAPSGAGEYPELPGPWRIGAGGVEAEAYSASQMRAYVDADRAARKPLADGVLHALYADVMTGHYADGLHYWRGTPAHRFARAIEQAHGIAASKKGGQHGTD